MPFRPSQNDYDWLGPGAYFWESDPQRGLDFAGETSRRKGASIQRPTVIGAVIDLGLCLDLSTSSAIQIIGEAYESLISAFALARRPLPENSRDLLLRRLDCAVITQLHAMLEPQSISIDAVRGVFLEGSPIYPNSGFNSKTHCQIAVRNLDCIKGVFRVPESQLRRS